MQTFQFVAVEEAKNAIEKLAAAEQSRYLAGGTTLVDLMKIYVETPDQLVDIQHLPLSEIKVLDDRVEIGAMVRNSDLADHSYIKQHYPVLSEALLSGATPQIRNMASVGGNLLQRTRCTYFRDIAWPCNKREPGAGCAAIDGHNRMHALLGTSDKCIATHPSDMCVAMMALDAVIQTLSSDGGRQIPIQEFYVAYGDDPAKENVLEPGELITGVTLPKLQNAAKSHYLKVRDRAAFEFALASAAVVLDLKGKDIVTARIALGGVAAKPWRSLEAEHYLVGKSVSEATFKAAAVEALKAAKPQKDNAFKIELARRTLVRALQNAAEIPS